MAENALILSGLLDLHGVRMVAERSGLSDVYLYKIKTGERRPTAEVYARVFNGYGSAFDLVRQLEIDADDDDLPGSFRDRVNNEIVLVVTLARGMATDGSS